MKVLIFSDVHANGPALDAVFDAARECSVRLCLGDVVGYGADPNHACQRVREAATAAIRGNHDRACAGLSDLNWFNPSAAAAARWTHAQLTPDNLVWLRDLPAGPLAHPQGVLVHGSPRDEDEYLMGLDQAAECFAATSAPLQWFGHTHIQGGFEWHNGAVNALSGTGPAPVPAGPWTPATRALDLHPDRRYLINPGSVGQPRDGDARAAFVVYDDERSKLEFHRVPYDLRQAQTSILRAGLPARLAYRLAEGR